MAIAEDLRVAAQRAFKSDFLRETATAAEREELARAGIAAGAAQDYAAWRRSMLLLGAGLLALAALLSLVGFETAETALASGFIQGGHDEDAVRANVRHNVGEGNLRILDVSSSLEVIALVLGAAFAAAALRRWKEIGPSRRMARFGWYGLLGVPLLNAAFPWAKALDFSHLDAQSAELWGGMFAMVGVVGVLVSVAPKVVAVFPGIMRASMTVKTLVHESAVPGYMAVLCAPVYAIFLVVVFSAVNQFKGDVKLMLGLGCLIAGAMVYALRAKDLMRSHTAEEATAAIRRVRGTAMAFNGAGAALLAWFLVSMLELGVLDVVQFFATALGGLLMMMVVAADFLLVLISREHAQAHRFHASPLAAEFERKLGELSTVLR